VSPDNGQQTLHAGSLEIRTSESTVLAEGRPLVLSMREYLLLVALARTPDRILSREELFAAAWKARLREGDRSVDVYVRRLRVKLRAALPGWTYIHTLGFGYRFGPEPANGLSHPVHKPVGSSHQTAA
jgi:DNA-binding response OmpR family regulator